MKRERHFANMRKIAGSESSCRHQQHEAKEIMTVFIRHCALPCCAQRGSYTICGVFEIAEIPAMCLWHLSPADKVSKR